MKNNRGVTLVALVATIIVMTVIASIVIVTSVKTYVRMKFDVFKAEMEELQRKVDEICEDYKVYLKDKETTEETYSAYFTEIYGASPALLTAIDSSKTENIIPTYIESQNTHEGYVFYVYSEEIERYFDLKGIDMDIIVDFSTREIYSVKGIKNPENQTERYYTASDWENKVNTLQTSQKTITSSLVRNSDLPTLNATSTKKEIGRTVMYKIELSLEGRPVGGTDYPITKVYYSNDTSEPKTWFKLENAQINGDEITAIVYKTGRYYFKVEDSSGASKEFSNELSVGRTVLIDDPLNPTPWPGGGGGGIVRP